MSYTKVLERYDSEIEEYQKQAGLSPNVEFNFFSCVSDYYRRENFHSDIFKALLIIPEFFKTFFEELSRIKKVHFYFDYYKSEVYREKERIDVLIVDNECKKAIIVENKINNAVDMPRQLPRYFESLSGKGIEVMDVIYLSLNGNKSPDESDWKDNDRENLKNRITNMSAVYRTDMLNLNSIISKAITNTNNIDHIVFLRQYKNLIDLLSIQELNHLVMEQLYSKIKTSNELNKLLTIKKLIEELPKYRAIRIKEHFKDRCFPFKEVLLWKPHYPYFDKLLIHESDFALDIICNNDNYEVSFFDRNANNNETAINFIGSADLGFDVRPDDRRIYKIFTYPENETDLYQFIEKAIHKIRQIVASEHTELEQGASR